MVGADGALGTSSSPDSDPSASTAIAPASSNISIVPLAHRYSSVTQPSEALFTFLMYL